MSCGFAVAAATEWPYAMASRKFTAAGEKADCVITADPVAFLQLAYGRIPPWRPVIGGKMFASGRKPWLAVKFGTLLSSP